MLLTFCCWINFHDFLSSADCFLLTLKNKFFTNLDPDQARHQIKMLVKATADKKLLLIITRLLFLK